MDDELPPMFQNTTLHEQIPTLVNSDDDDVSSYQQSATATNITNPINPEIMNQPTARVYKYMKPKRRY